MECDVGIDNVVATLVMAMMMMRMMMARITIPTWTLTMTTRQLIIVMDVAMVMEAMACMLLLAQALLLCVMMVHIDAMDAVVLREGSKLLFDTCVVLG